jgi:PTS system nitrogen regulatory IIA component
MHLADLIKPELVFVDLPGSDRPTVLKAMADRLAGAAGFKDADALYQRLWEREELGSTAVGSGVAIPHCKMRKLDAVTVAVGVSHRDIDFESEDGEPVRLLFLVVSPEDRPAEHLQSLSAISKWLKSEPDLQQIMKSDDPSEIYRRLAESEG